MDNSGEHKHLGANIPITAVGILKVQNHYEKKRIEKTDYCIKYLQHKKLVCKIWYQPAVKCGTHKHLDTYTPINATFSKPKHGLKIEKFENLMPV